VILYQNYRQLMDQRQVWNMLVSSSWKPTRISYMLVFDSFESPKRCNSRTFVGTAAYIWNDSKLPPPYSEFHWELPLCPKCNVCGRVCSTRSGTVLRSRMNQSCEIAWECSLLLRRMPAMCNGYSMWTHRIGNR
jgi:hypothetical protein